KVENGRFIGKLLPMRSPQAALWHEMPGRTHTSHTGDHPPTQHGRCIRGALSAESNSAYRTPPASERTGQGQGSARARGTNAQSGFAGADWYDPAACVRLNRLAG